MIKMTKLGFYSLIGITIFLTILATVGLINHLEKPIGQQVEIWKSWEEALKTNDDGLRKSALKATTDLSQEEVEAFAAYGRHKFEEGINKAKECGLDVDPSIAAWQKCK